MYNKEWYVVALSPSYTSIKGSRRIRRIAIAKKNNEFRNGGTGGQQVDAALLFNCIMWLQVLSYKFNIAS